MHHLLRYLWILGLVSTVTHLYYAIQMHLCQVDRTISISGTEMRSNFVQDTYFIMVPRDDPNVGHSHWGSDGSIRETIVPLLLTMSV